MDTFGCAIDCIDGRAQMPVIEWVKFHGSVQYVDMITEPGADGCLAREDSKITNRIHHTTQVAIRAHNPSIIAVCGHFDCVANPVSNEEHIADIKKSAGIVGHWVPEIRVVGLFVNEFGSIDLICDSNEGKSEIKSFL
ncbi:MAG: hypothetical protein OEM82_00955 [Acidobacteriota bacterium]|nr:hypothetical protein [Acidobacteriota bacterium]MDH3528553.1 hypothetical protein [Acidobacteriota bacterium]